jgi:hypothetical protein
MRRMRITKLIIDDLQPTTEKISIQEISYLESVSLVGGYSNNFQELVRFGIKSMEFILLAYAIDSIYALGTSFNNS